MAVSAPSRRRAVIWNLGFSYVSLALVLVRNLVLVPVYLRFIDVAEFGAWLGTGEVLSYLMISDFGLTGVIVQRTGAAYGSGQSKRLGEVIGTSLGIAIALSAVMASLAALAAPWLPRILDLDPAYGQRIADCFLIVGLANGMNLIGLSTAAVLRSLQRPVVPGATEVFADLANVVVTVILLWRGFGLYSLAVGLAVRSLSSVIVNASVCLVIVMRMSGVGIRWSGARAGDMLRQSALQMTTSIAMRLQGRIDTFFVTLLIGPAAAAVYGLTLRAHETVQLIAGRFGAAIVPSLAHLHGAGGDARLKQVVGRMVQAHGIVVGLGLGGVIAFNASFVALWVGSDQYGGTAVNVLFASYIAVVVLSGSGYAIASAQGRFGAIAKIMAASAVVRIALLVVLLPLGLWGGALAALASGTLRLALFSDLASRLAQAAAGWSRRWGLRVAKTLCAPLALSGIPPVLPVAIDTWTRFAIATTSWIVLAAGATFLINRSSILGLFEELRPRRSSRP